VSRQGGFTLLEVLVAFAILSITIVVAVQGFAQGLRLLKLSGDHQSAILIADQRAREVVMPKEGHENGTDGSYTWDRTIKELPTAELDVPGRGSQERRERAWVIATTGRERILGVAPDRLGAERLEPAERVVEPLPDQPLQQLVAGGALGAKALPLQMSPDDTG